MRLWTNGNPNLHDILSAAVKSRFDPQRLVHLPNQDFKFPFVKMRLNYGLWILPLFIRKIKSIFSTIKKWLFAISSIWWTFEATQLYNTRILQIEGNFCYTRLELLFLNYLLLFRFEPYQWPSKITWSAWLLKKSSC